MDQRQRWIRRWAVFFFLGTLLWSASVSPQQPQIGKYFEDQATATATTPVEVPNLIGSQRSQAPILLNRRGLQLGGVANRADPRPPGTIVDQTPAAGQRVRRGTRVNIWVAVPQVQDVGVPNLMGLNRAQATALLNNSSLRLGNVAVRGDGGPPATIVGQTPPAGQMVPRGSFVHVRVAAQDQRVPVPSVVNMQENHARQDIFDSKLKIGLVTRIHHDRPAGMVVRQQPEAGTRVRRGSKVALWVSLGPIRDEEPEKVRVPDLLRKKPEAARELLESQGLVLGEVAEWNSESHREGTIMRQQPEAGEWVNRGKQVNVWIARRRPDEPPPFQPPPREITRVPDLKGKTLKQARGLLNESRLRQGAVGRRYSLGSAGNIIGQNPLAGSEVQIRSAVNLWVAQSIPPIIWATGGLLTLISGYGVYRVLRKKRPSVEPKPMDLKAIAKLDEGRFKAAWKDGEESRMEICLRARPELGTQDLEAPGPLIKRERREHE